MAEQTYRLTFGHHVQKEAWSDIRSLTWAELRELLTRHVVGTKAGTCIVPAVFSGGRRRKSDAVQIDVAMLDSDSGATLDEIRTAITARGWAAIISSTHSHLTTRTIVKRTAWDKYCQSYSDKATAEAFLLHEKDYLPRIAANARLAGEVGKHLLFEHEACPKFRVAIPLLRSWRATDYKDALTAGSAWKARIEALAAALTLPHDQACTDTSRLFFLPRRPSDGPPPETAVLEGKACDIFALPDPARGGSAGRTRRSTRRPRSDDEADFTDPDTGVIFGLRGWARSYGHRFLLVKALEARQRTAFVGKVADRTRYHISCPNEAEHTNAGADLATFICDAGSIGQAKGFVIHCRHAHCDGRDRLFFLRRMLERRWLSTEDLTHPDFLAGNAPVRPVIRFVAGEIADIVDQAEHALLQADVGIYQRGPFVVRPGDVRIAVSKGREVSARRILPVQEHGLVEAMTVAATWEKFDGRKDEWVRIDAPLKVASIYAQRLGRWRLPTLSGLIEAPTLRSDGTILAEAGYDRTTGLLLDTGGVTYPRIPDRPSRDDARRALDRLVGLIATFPFVDQASRSVALSAILTACIRRSLRTAPMHAFTAPTAGSGKSKLVDLASVIASGREAGVLAQGKTEEELEKRLGALLLAGDQVIAIDNCEVPLGGEFLCSMLTQQIVRLRILGRSEAPELPANAFVTATGNNLILMGDMTRRAVLCGLDPKEERPELRRFDRDPIETVKAHRPEFLIAALTVLRAHYISGRPDAPAPLGSFEDRSNWVRASLIWLGQADPVLTMEEARDLDPRLDALIAVVAQWRHVIGETAVSTREIIEHATRQRTGLDSGSLAYPSSDFCSPDFREALLAVAGQGGAINGQRLGKWLGANKERLIAGARIVQLGFTNGVMHWRLEVRNVAGAGARV